MPDRIRLFVAAQLGDELRAELEQFQRQQRENATFKSIRWVAPKNIHLTFKFLGDTDRAQIPALKTALSRAVEGVRPFELSASSLGCFPNLRRPNNIWVGLDGQLQQALLLAKRIEDECRAVGFPADNRGFTPHLTLGRVRRDATPAQRAEIGKAVQEAPPRVFGVIRVDKVKLIHSDLRPDGPIYTVIETAYLEGVEPT